MNRNTLLHWIFQQLMNEAEYLMKNYGDLAGCYPPRSTASTSKILHVIRKPNFSPNSRLYTLFIIIFFLKKKVTVRFFDKLC